MVCLLVVVVAVARAQDPFLLAIQNDWGGVLKDVDATTGATASIAALGKQMASLAYDPAGNILYGSEWMTGDLYEVDYDTADPTDPDEVMQLIGSTGLTELFALAFDVSSGTLYGAHGAYGEDGFYSIDVSTGQATLVGNTGFFHADHSNAVSGMAFDPFSGRLYGAVAGDTYAWGALIEIDPTTGAGSLIGEYTPHIDALSFHPTTGDLYGLDGRNGKLYTIDIDTAELTELAGLPLGRPFGLEFVPEPATVLMLGIGGLALIRRRRKGG
jgi:DNA-binding beta-propeller fold protein YncE